LEFNLKGTEYFLKLISDWKLKIHLKLVEQRWMRTSQKDACKVTMKPASDARSGIACIRFCCLRLPQLYQVHGVSSKATGHFIDTILFWEKRFCYSLVYCKNAFSLINRSKNEVDNFQKRLHDWLGVCLALKWFLKGTARISKLACFSGSLWQKELTVFFGKIYAVFLTKRIIWCEVDERCWPNL